MDGLLYPISLLVVVLIAFFFYRNNSFKLMLLTLAVGVYIIYSQETGNTVTNLKNEAVQSIDKSAESFSKSRGIEGYDEKKTIETVKGTSKNP
ncbi:MAG: hypothetical protein PHO62_08770 [Sulfurimonas sp.]|uniref:hypothetical protein n=1 Tax=Sulfurimonas sp. TaxID=2022749 RepID=UPI00260E9F40|nr:hypothetical protein [Sulfurimonas sp.]MDD5373504.1 hypothetical protein [Sulfurimonas sp.]